MPILDKLGGKQNKNNYTLLRYKGMSFKTKNMAYRGSGLEGDLSHIFISLHLAVFLKPNL